MAKGDKIENGIVFFANIESLASSDIPTVIVHEAYFISYVSRLF